MTLLQLKYALAVAKYGSVSLAARHLFISQPSLTESLSSLEQEIQQTLFVRSSRGMKPTDVGRNFLGYARQVVEQMRLLEDVSEVRLQPQLRALTVILAINEDAPFHGLIEPADQIDDR